MSESKDRPSQRFGVIGWREWVTLPGFAAAPIKAKVDTGARTSALHAFDLKRFDRDGSEWVRFSTQPRQGEEAPTMPGEAKVLDWRFVTSSGGHRSFRPVIVVDVSLLGVVWPVELTLARRDTMGFRMLLGRQAVRHRFLVDPGRSYLGGKPKRKKRKTPKDGDASAPVGPPASASAPSVSSVSEPVAVAGPRPETAD